MSSALLSVPVKVKFCKLSLFGVTCLLTRHPNLLRCAVQFSALACKRISADNKLSKQQRRVSGGLAIQITPSSSSFASLRRCLPAMSRYVQSMSENGVAVSDCPSSSPSPTNKRPLSPTPVDGSPAVAPPSADNASIDQQPAKRQRLVQDAEYKKRGQRMFGVLVGTLNKFREEGSKQTDAVSSFLCASVYGCDPLTPSTDKTAGSSRAKDGGETQVGSGRARPGVKPCSPREEPSLRRHKERRREGVYRDSRASCLFRLCTCPWG
jgi:hypothetical protein